MMMGFISQIPYEIEESGIIDGCSTFKVLVLLILPLIGPGLATTAIFNFLTGWNEYLFAVTFISDSGARTIPVALMAFDTGRNTYWGHVCLNGYLADSCLCLYIGGTKVLSGRRHAWCSQGLNASHTFHPLYSAPL